MDKEDYKNYIRAEDREFWNKIQIYKHCIYVYIVHKYT